jgi:hypothetical protein
MFEKALTGFNHNVTHRGKVYHVQTEDSGIANPHIITHLFVGGNIIASKRTSYANIVKAERISEIVRDLMEEQHKEMLRNLVSGLYDSVQTRPAAIRPEPTPAPAEVPPTSSDPGPKRAAPSAADGSKGAGTETGFGEGLISGRSLDEVILSYLAGKGDQ